MEENLMKDGMGQLVFEQQDDTQYLFNRTGVASEGVDGFGAVTAQHHQFFQEQGYLVIHNAFSSFEVQAALEGLLDLIAGKRPDFKGIEFEAKAKDILPTLSLENKQDAIRKLWQFVNYSPPLKALAEHPQLLKVVEQLIGQVPAMLQDMALLKPPLIGREKPWHQDSAFFKLPLQTPVVGVWIALDEATIENGCMHIKPGSHLQGPQAHFQIRDWQICDKDVDLSNTVSVPLEPGGCLLFHSLLQHGTPTSHSAQRRRAVQFHYRPKDIEEISEQERLKLFGGMERNLTC